MYLDRHADERGLGLVECGRRRKCSGGEGCRRCLGGRRRGSGGGAGLQRRLGRDALVCGRGRGRGPPSCALRAGGLGLEGGAPRPQRRRLGRRQRLGGSQGSFCRRCPGQLPLRRHLTQDVHGRRRGRRGQSRRLRALRKLLQQSQQGRAGGCALADMLRLRRPSHGRSERQGLRWRQLVQVRVPPQQRRQVGRLRLLEPLRRRRRAPVRELCL